MLIRQGVWERLGVEPGGALSLDVREGGDGAWVLELKPILESGGLGRDEE